MLYFENDYCEGAHPAILQKLTETNFEKVSGYAGTRTTLSLSNTLSAICLKIGNAIGPVISFAMTTSNFASIN